MANMFSGNNKKEIPQNLSECTRTNVTVYDLHSWSEWLEKWGKVFFWAIVIIGAIISIGRAVETHDFRSEYYYELDELVRLGTPVPSVAEVFITNALTWALYAFIEYCIYHTLALLFSALASITQNTMISANVALLEASKEGEQTEANTQKRKIFNDSDPKATPSEKWHRPVPEGMWECRECGTHNKSTYSQCKHCGEYRK